MAAGLALCTSPALIHTPPEPRIEVARKLPPQPTLDALGKRHFKLAATFNKFNAFVENAVEVINFQSDSLVIALSNTAPTSGNSVLADITEIAYTNLSARAVTTGSSSQSSGTYKLVCADLVLTASGAVATFRYVVLYDDTPSSPADPLVGWWDHGSGVTLANGETYTIDFDGTNGVLSLT